jgi:hypothetical protein
MGMGFWDKVKEQVKEDAGMVPTLKLEYLGGHPKIKGKEAKVQKGREPNMLKINKVELDVTNIQWQEQGSRSLGKAAAGTIVGGLLTGGIGAVAGAAIGGRKKDKSTAVINAIDGNVTVRCSQDEFKKLTELMG